MITHLIVLTAYLSMFRIQQKTFLFACLPLHLYFSWGDNLLSTKLNYLGILQLAYFLTLCESPILLVISPAYSKIFSQRHNFSCLNVFLFLPVLILPHYFFLVLILTLPLSYSMCICLCHSNNHLAHFLHFHLLLTFI